MVSCHDGAAAVRYTGIAASLWGAGWGGGLFNLHICSLRLRICNVRNLRLSLCTKGSTGKFKCYVTDVKSTVPSPPHPPVSYLVLRPTIMRGLIENSLTPPKNKPSTHATKCAWPKWGTSLESTKWLLREVTLPPLQQPLLRRNCVNPGSYYSSNGPFSGDKGCITGCVTRLHISAY